MKEFRNILIVRTDRMGDVVLTTPSIKAAREHYSQSRITILAAPATQAIVDGNPYLDEVMIDDRLGEHKGLWGFLKLVLALRRRKFDLAVIYHTKRRTNLACFLAGIPYRIGYKNNKFGFLLNHPVEDTRHQGIQHEVQYCLDIFGHLGVGVQKIEMHVPLQRAAQDWLSQFLTTNNISQNEKLIIIHPGASDFSKCWSAYRFAELIKELNKRFEAQFFLIGSSQIQGISDQIASMVPFKVLNLVGKTTLAQTISLLNRAFLLVSNDSGPVHLAAGLGTPVVSIFTRNQPGINPERWRPLGERSRFVAVSFNDQISFAKAGGVEPPYSELISTQQVLEAVDALLKLC